MVRKWTVTQLPHIPSCRIRIATVSQRPISTLCACSRVVTSDAVVVIVSEETGTISVAVGGMLKRHLAPQTLERLLRNELIPVQNEQEGNALLRLKEKLLHTEKEEHKNEK